MPRRKELGLPNADGGEGSVKPLQESGRPPRATRAPQPGAESQSLGAGIAPKGAQGRSRALEGLRILVCEDDEDARELLVEVLRPTGAHVSVAESVPEAMDRFRDERPEVIVSDIGLPLIDGYTFMREIRSLTAEEGGETPAIALTAFAAERDVRAAHAAGFQRHMVKPVAPGDLVQAIAALARGSGD